MTDPRLLLEIQPAASLLLFAAEAKDGAEVAAGWRDAGLAVRVARGRKMRTVERLFDEFAAALQFPYYFGENWAAFGECLADMDWLPPGSGYVIVITEPAEVLAAEPITELATLTRSIAHAGRTYAQPIELGEWWDRPALPFHVVLHAEPAAAGAVQDRWRASGALVEALLS